MFSSLTLPHLVSFAPISTNLFEERNLVFARLKISFSCWTPMRRGPRSNSFPKFRKGRLEGTEENIPKPKECKVTVLKMTEPIELNWNFHQGFRKHLLKPTASSNNYTKHHVDAGLIPDREFYTSLKISWNNHTKYISFPFGISSRQESKYTHNSLSSCCY